MADYKCWFCQINLEARVNQLDGSVRHYLPDGGFMGYCKAAKACPQCVNPDCGRCHGTGVVFKPKYPGGEINELES